MQKLFTELKIISNSVMVVIGQSLCCFVRESNPAPCDTAYGSFDAKGWATQSSLVHVALETPGLTICQSERTQLKAEILMTHIVVISDPITDWLRIKR